MDDGDSVVVRSSLSAAVGRGLGRAKGRRVPSHASRLLPPDREPARELARSFEVTAGGSVYTVHDSWRSSLFIWSC